MSCGDGPGVGTSQCPALKQYYNTVKRSSCSKDPNCPPRSEEYPSGWYGYKSWTNCENKVANKRRCCSPRNPPHISAQDYQCCAGQLVGQAANGYCNADSCPYSDFCNGYMQTVCQLPTNLGAWYTKNGSCGTYVANASLDPRYISVGSSILLGTMQNQFPNPYQEVDLESAAFPMSVQMAQTYCPMYPGLCDSVLENYCKTVTRDDVVKNESLRTLCGCFMPSEEYPYEGFVSRGCSVSCNGQDNIKPKDWTCDQTVCIIDDVDVNMVNSQGNIDLSQICGPGGKNSACLLKDVSINEINSKVGGGLDINQKCGLCYQWEPSLANSKINTSNSALPAGWVEIPCAGRSGIPSASTIEKWAIIGVAIAILIALIILFFVWLMG